MNKQTVVNTVASIAGAAIAVVLVGTLVFSHAALQPHGLIGHAASAAATDSPSPSPIDSPVAIVASPTPPIVATITNPLPPASSAPAPAPSSAPAAPAAPAPASPVPSPTDVPSPTPPPSPAPAPTPPAPSPTPVSVAPCSWSVAVSTLSDQATGTWSSLGTWTGSAASSTSPIFIMATTGYLRYVYSFSSACVGHTVLASYDAFNNAPIYTVSITTTVTQTQEANLPPNTQVAFKVTLS